ncbi:MAG: amidohydrolase [Saprospiraceae bacterium]|nr:amidohydrolase [Saprospiraceae bacterium]
MKVSLIQTALSWEDRAANLDQIGAQLAQLPTATDLVVLPEMFTTGFTMNPAQVAEQTDGPTLDWLRRQAAQLDAAITGSFVVEENGNFYNRLAWVFPDGKFKTYDKRHLFTLAGEDQFYTAGTDRLIIEWKAWKICPLICYDLRFPVWSRNDIGYDLLIYVANWPERRRHHWRSLLMGRAIENQVYTIGLNRVGVDGKDIRYTGDSCVIDYNGELRASLTIDTAVVTIELDKASQTAFRERYAFLADQDQFAIA